MQPPSLPPLVVPQDGGWLRGSYDTDEEDAIRAWKPPAGIQGGYATGLSAEQLARGVDLILASLESDDG